MVTQHKLLVDTVHRAKAGDGRAFEDLLSPVLAPAFRLAMTMLKDRSAAEDAVQDAALKAWRKVDRFRSDSDLRPWFLTIVANECGARPGRASIGPCAPCARPWRRRSDDDARGA